MTGMLLAIIGEQKVNNWIVKMVKTWTEAVRGSRCAQLSLRYRRSRIAFRLSAFASRSPVSIRPSVGESAESGSLHAGQRFANPGLSGLSSNSSEQTTHTLIGKGIYLHFS